jgi:putative SOS response-associated peptidase YedK
VCGRFTLRTKAEVLRAELDLAELPSDLTARFNVAPTQPVAIVPNRVPRRLGLVRWGLIPFWAKDPSIGNRQINARAETLLDKPAYREAFAQRRCLVVADGFYEWKKEGKRKIPIFIHRPDDAPFAFAGLWEVWRAPDGSKIASCAIVTTEPNDLLRPIHDRMPVILPREAWEKWLAPGAAPPRDLLALLRPSPSDFLTTTVVSTYVNTPDHEGPECIEPAVIE